LGLCAPNLTSLRKKFPEHDFDAKRQRLSIKCKRVILSVFILLENSG
jgi:hypothetical protein